MVTGTGGQVLTEATVEQGLVEGGGGVAEQQPGQNAKGRSLEGVLDRAGQPGELNHAAPGRFVLGADREGRLVPARHGKANFGGDGAGDLAWFEMAQG